MRTIAEIRYDLKERGQSIPGDENCDSRLLLAILDELAHHIELLESGRVQKGKE